MLKAIASRTAILIDELGAPRKRIVLELESTGSCTIQLDIGKTVQLVKDSLNVIPIRISGPGKVCTGTLTLSY
ncbi:MAG: hypothetical protein IPK73_04510 [Candidatus Obscuribacter sp.]|nr:hypothetical protein [Candidatus Obscuribacter sp.]MBK9280942.1 hypothetical protein [Candidatus Obscuribacter sp.]